MIPPRYGTPRREDRPTTGGLVAATAESLGFELMPHQRHVADVTGELWPDPDTGRMVHAYSTVIVSLPRRGGKTALMLAVLINRLRQIRNARAWYTAQSRGDAAITFRDEWLPMIRSSPFATRLEVREANGSEAITLADRASRLRLFPPTRDGLHGQSSDIVCYDECWKHSLERGRELDLAARPTMATRPGAQQWLISAAGDADSGWWLETLEVGRTAAAADLGHGVCHLEWSADAPGLDLEDPDVWLESHPAVRSPENPNGTISLQWLVDEYNRDPGEFRRVYLNVSDRLTTSASPIDPGDWQAIAADRLPDRSMPIALGIDCAPEQTSTAIVAAVGGNVLEVLDHRPGWSWVPARVAELCDTYPIERVGLDGTSAANALAVPLQAEGVPLEVLQLRQVAAASAQLVSAISAREIRHVDHPSLTGAVEVARRRAIADGAWTWGRKDSRADVSPLVAASIARGIHPSITGQVGAVW